MNQGKSEAMKLKTFRAHQARLHQLWIAAGMDVPDDFEGNLMHYAMCAVIDRTEDEDLPSQFVGFNTKRSPLVEMGREYTESLDDRYATQGYATEDERDAHDECAEYYVTVRCHCCAQLNYITV